MYTFLTNKITCDKLLRCIGFSGDYAALILADILFERARKWSFHCIIFWNVTDNCSNIISAVYISKLHHSKFNVHPHSINFQASINALKRAKNK